MANYANVTQVQHCKQCGSPNVLLNLDEWICGDCGSTIGSIFDVPEDEANSVPVPTTCLPGRNFLPDLPAPFSLTTDNELHKSMMGSCPSDELAPEGLPYRANRDPGSAEQCTRSDTFPSNTRCFPEAQRKQKQWPDQRVILDAIIRGRDVHCPFYVGGGRPCSLHENVWLFCDGYLVAGGIMCPNRREDL